MNFTINGTKPMTLPDELVAPVRSITIENCINYFLENNEYGLTSVVDPTITISNKTFELQGTYELST